ncbi:MAG: hypothetical protein JRH11_03945 [Deltaproteobacteria bacterium]|nr:hypothetical protein [Deltaproteobacteria bacterium]
MTTRLMALAVCLLSCGLACGGGGYEAGVYEDSEARYRMEDPGAGWSRVDVAGENDMAFSNGNLAAVIQVNATCEPRTDAPLSALRNHLLIGWTEREIESEELVPMDDREALITHLIAKLDGVPRELVLTVLKKDGCIYDFALIAPPGDRFTQARPVYDRLLGTLSAGD